MGTISRLRSYLNEFGTSSQLVQSHSRYVVESPGGHIHHL